jgi:hypothetical protein
MRLFILASMLTVVAAVSAADAENKCNLAQEAELPINMSGLRPLITARD